ncbi:MAG: hypothetical protein NC218_01600 [Acetobacter sp.]|nr:hypothetical protein [Acetobacter sp.]
MKILQGKMFESKSYGMVGINRVGSGSTLGDKQMFMSDVSVGNFMELTIKSARVERDLHHDWPFGEQTLIKIQLSPIQFSELITNMNVGDGVPCTISYTKEDGHIKYEPLPAKIDMIREEADEQISKAESGVQSALSTLQAAIDGKGYLSKKQMQEIVDQLKEARYLYQNNDFAKRSAQEEISKMVLQAKAQVAAYVDHKIYSTGVAAIQDGFVAPQLNEGERKDDNE